METARFSEMFTSTSQFTGQLNPKEDHNCYCRENLKSQTDLMPFIIHLFKSLVCPFHVKHTKWVVRKELTKEVDHHVNINGNSGSVVRVATTLSYKAMTKTNAGF
jgi:hypothetical protein